MPPPRSVGKGAMRCFCPSAGRRVRSETQRHSVPKFGRKVTHLERDSHTSFQVKRSKVRVIRPINADTHRAPYLKLQNDQAYEFQTWYTPYTWTLSALEALRNALYKFKTYLLTYMALALLFSITPTKTTLKSTKYGDFVVVLVTVYRLPKFVFERTIVIVL